MKYLSGMLFGLGGAVVAVVLWVLVAFVLPIFLPMLISRLTGSGGASGARITTDSIMLAGVIGFAAGFVFGVRK